MALEHSCAARVHPTCFWRGPPCSNTRAGHSPKNNLRPQVASKQAPGRAGGGIQQGFGWLTGRQTKAPATPSTNMARKLHMKQGEHAMCAPALGGFVERGPVVTGGRIWGVAGADLDCKPAGLLGDPPADAMAASPPLKTGGRALCGCGKDGWRGLPALLRAQANIAPARTQ
eukprot:1158503-Pelagomonas_calceolata.AAC.5